MILILIELQCYAELGSAYGIEATTNPMTNSNLAYNSVQNLA